jgi:sporulation protein YlmC with PRC-barrel domain
MRKLLTTISVASLLAITPALAQTGPTSPPSSMPDKSEPMPDKTTPKAPEKAPDMTTPKAPSTSSDAPSAKLAPASTGQHRASDVLNARLTNAAGETVGDVNDLLLDNSGKVTHVVVGVGGFLGIGERNVALKFEQVQISRDSSNRISASANVTKDSLNAAPEWKDPNAAASSSSQTSPPSSSPSTKPRTQ